jgi:hypothetical protein
MKMAETTLLELYNKHKKGDWPDKGSTHSYIEVYKEILAPYRKTAKNILEIGLMSGESLRMWADYFDGTVYGMDCSIKPIDGKADLTQAIADGLNIVIGDASSQMDVAKFFTGKKFDVVIEDANHDLEQQRGIFLTMMPYMALDGIYIIEDIQSVENANKLASEFNCEIIDLRRVKNRYDDLLAIIRI